MTALAGALNKMGAQRKKLLSAGGRKQLDTLARLDAAKVEGAIVSAALALQPMISNFLLANMAAAGLHSKSGTMAEGLRNVYLTVSVRVIKINLPTGMRYKNGKGDPYAAAGAFKYGGVWQPLFKRKGEIYYDRISGRARQRKSNAGALGSRLKRTVKEAVLKHGKIVGLGTRSRDAFERAQETSRRRLGKPIDLNHGITVRAPKFPFFTLTDGQKKAVQSAWDEGVGQRLKAMGMAVKHA